MISFKWWINLYHAEKWYFFCVRLIISVKNHFSLSQIINFLTTLKYLYGQTCNILWCLIFLCNQNIINAPKNFRILRAANNHKTNSSSLNLLKKKKRKEREKQTVRLFLVCFNAMQSNKTFWVPWDCIILFNVKTITKQIMI